MLAVYDLNTNAITYNFAEFLVLCNNEIKENNIDHYKIIFINKNYDSVSFKYLKNKNYYLENDKYGQNLRIDKIIIPLIDLVGDNCVGYDFLNSINDFESNLKSYYIYPKNYNGFFKPTHEIEKLHNLNPISNISLQATNDSIDLINIYFKKRSINKNRLITITIREQKYDTSRNSNISAWIEFKKFLELNKFQVLLIPDTENIDSLDSFLNKESIFKNAAKNLNLRMALYQESFFNYFTSGGPSALCYLNYKTKYCVFNHGPIEGSLVNTNKAFKHLKKNTNYKFCIDKLQTLKWEKDNYQNLINSYNEILK